jgi:uracil-DNA glycosylase
MGTVFVPGEGRVVDASLVLIGEAPGREEESLQRPFVGAAGRNLIQLLLEIGLTREDVFITNLIKFRPMNGRGMNRSPSPAEQRQALPLILEELKILKPRLAVCLGLSAAKVLIDDRTLKMNAANGTIFHQHFFPTIVTYHPSPLNYCSPAKRDALHSAFLRIRSLLAF